MLGRGELFQGARNYRHPSFLKITGFFLILLSLPALALAQHPEGPWSQLLEKAQNQGQTRVIVRLAEDGLALTCWFPTFPEPSPGLSVSLQDGVGPTILVATESSTPAITTAASRMWQAAILLMDGTTPLPGRRPTGRRHDWTIHSGKP